MYDRILPGDRDQRMRSTRQDPRVVQGRYEGAEAASLYYIAAPTPEDLNETK